MTVRDLLNEKRRKAKLRLLKKKVLLRFVKGLVAAAVAAGIAFALDSVADTPELVPPTLVPIVTAALLAAQKWLKERPAE